MPRKKVFDVLFGFGGLEKLVPDVLASLTVSGSGVGATRTGVIKSGGSMVERLDVAYDERVFGYTITANDALPFKNYCAVVALEDSGTKTIARYGSNWDADGTSDKEIVDLLSTLYTRLLEGLHTLV